MARSGAEDTDSRIESLWASVEQLARVIRPVREKADRLERTLKQTQDRVFDLETDFRKLREKEREQSKQHDVFRAGLGDAAGRTASVEREIAVIDTVVSSAIPFLPPAFDELKDTWQAPAFDPPGNLGTAESAPRPEDYDPGPPSSVLRLFGLAGWQERRQEDGRAEYEEALEQHGHREALRELELGEWHARYVNGKAERQATADARNAEVERMRAAFDAGDPEAIGWFVREALERSAYPHWYPARQRQVRAVCRAGRGDVFVELELPPVAVIPPVRRYQYDEHQAVCLPVPRTRDEVGLRYSGLIASVALRTVGEVLAATQPHAGLVRSVTVNGRVRVADPGTGADARPHLLSAVLTREAFAGLKLAGVQPLVCLSSLGARISPDSLAPDEVEPLESYPVNATTAEANEPGSSSQG